MALIWHRPLVPEDIETAHRLRDQHQPLQELRGENERVVCTNAGHWNGAPAWPCARIRWAQAVLSAKERGEVGSALLLGNGPLKVVSERIA